MPSRFDVPLGPLLSTPRGRHSGPSARWFPLGLRALALLGLLVAPVSAGAELFGTPSFYQIARPWDCALLDANRDGLEDLLITQTHVNSATVLLNVGGAELEHGWTFRPAKSPAGVIAKDFNADSFDDIPAPVTLATL